MDETADVLLAYKMNGKELSPDHGYPIRLIVPGYIGGRMVSDTDTGRIPLAFGIPYRTACVCVSVQPLLAAGLHLYTSLDGKVGM